MSSKHPQEEDESDTRLGYWMIYTTRVHPVVKILHKPSYDKRFATRREREIKVDCDVNAVMSSICLAAVHSCAVSEVRTYFSDSKQALLSRHRVATERALVTSLQTDYPSVAGLQALAIYLVRNLANDSERLEADFASHPRVTTTIKSSLGVSSGLAWIYCRTWASMMTATSNTELHSSKICVVGSCGLSVS